MKYMGCGRKQFELFSNFYIYMFWQNFDITCVGIWKWSLVDENIIKNESINIEVKTYETVGYKIPD